MLLTGTIYRLLIFTLPGINIPPLTQPQSSLSHEMLIYIIQVSDKNNKYKKHFFKNILLKRLLLISLCSIFVALIYMTRRSLLSASRPSLLLCHMHESLCVYIIPMPPPPIGGIAGVSSLMSATTDSVVSRVDATEVAFCNAERVTFTGSIIPASIILT